MTIQIVDDLSGSGFALAGPWTALSGFGGYGAHYYAATVVGLNPAATATYTFAVVSGVKVRVSATWAEYINRSTGVTYKVYNGAVDPANLVWTQVVNQQLAPSDYTDAGGVPWGDLAVLVPTGTVLTVVLSNTSGGDGLDHQAIADAVRVSDADFPTPRITHSIDPESIRPSESATVTFGWAVHNPDSSGVDLAFTCPVGTPSPSSAHLSGASGSATLSISLAIPVGAAIGDHTLTATPAAIYAAIPIAYNVPVISARLRAGSLMVDPSLNQLRGIAERTSDGADTTVTGALNDGSMTLQWDSVSRGAGSITLARPMFQVNCTYFWWALNRGHWAHLDDSDATKAGAGWSTFPGAPNNTVVGNSRSATSSASDTITYTFTGVVPGTYWLSTSVLDYDPSWTPAATFKVYDGAVAGSPAATLTVDQTAPRTVDDFDDVIPGNFRVRHVGQFTVAGTTANVVVSNPGGVGLLAVDALKIVRRQDAECTAVPPDATNVRWDAPDRCVTTGAGDLAGQDATPAVLATEAQWFGGNPDAPKTLRLGYNKNFQNGGEQSLWHANLLRGATEIDDSTWSIDPQGTWKRASGDATPITDQDGYLIGMTGAPAAGQSAFTLNIVHAGFGDVTTLNFPCIPASGTLRIKYATPDGAHLPTYVRGFDPLGGTTTFDAPSSPVVDPHGSGYFVVTQAYRPAQPEPRTASPWGVLAAGPISLETDGVADVRFVAVDEVVPPDWPHETHPVLYDRLKGRGFTLRVMQALQIVGARDGHWADRARPARLSAKIPSRTIEANLVSVGPVSPSDPIVQQYFDGGNKEAIVRYTVDSTAGFTNGHSLPVSASPATVLDTAGGGNPPTVFTPGTIDLQNYNNCVVEDATHFVGYVYTNTNFIDGLEHPILTAATTTAITGRIYIPTGLGEAHESIITLANETDTDLWVTLPHGGADDYATGMGTLYGSTLDPARTVILELGDETPWHGGGVAFGVAVHWFRMLARKYQYEYALDSSKPHPINAQEAFAQRSAELFTLFTDAFVAAGGDRAKVKWALMGFTGGLGETIGQSLAYFTSGRMGPSWPTVPRFHYIGGDGYMQNFPLPGAYGQAYTQAAWDDLDDSGIVSLIGTHQQYGDPFGLQGATVAAQAASYPYPVEHAIYEYGYENMCPQGSDGIIRSRSAVRHPRMYHCRLGRHRIFQENGVTLAIQYFLDSADGTSNGVNWDTFDNIETAVGTGDPAENANPFAIGRLSMMGGADRAWMADLMTGGIMPDFAPTDIAGLQLWLKADALSLADADPIGAWPDSSAGGNDGSSSTTHRPAWKAAILGGLPVARLDGTDDFVDCGVIDLHGAWTMAAVFELSALADFSAILADFSAAFDAAQHSLHLLPTGAFQVTVVNGAISKRWETAAGVVSVGTAHRVVVTADGTLADGGVVLHLDGTSVGLTPTAVGGFVTIPTSGLGATAIGRLGSGDAYYFAGDIPEVLLYDSALGTVDLASLDDYLAARYFSSSSTPGHAPILQPGTWLIGAGSTITVGPAPAPASASAPFFGSMKVANQFNHLTAPINATASGANVVVAGQAGYRLTVGRFALKAADAVTATFKSSGGTSISGPLPFAAAGDGMVDSELEHGLFKTALGEGLNLNLSGAVAVGGYLTYWFE